ncbi:MAG: aldo/keto reductase [Phycisphaerales bacterium]|nr:aldo/keto reductase [Phycisphaerales bacterium]
MTRPTRREFLASAAAIAAFSGSIGAAQSEGAGRTTAGSGSTGSGPSPLERRKFGATDMTVTVLGFGGAEIGYQDVDQAIVDRLLNSALDAGLNVIDTAECYADSEEAIGRSVSGRRNDYFLFTKVGHMEPGEAGWTPASIERSIDRSLERLKTDRVDLVQLHSCDLDTLKRGACIDALERARKAGKTRYIGYSGDGAAALFAVESGRFDALQTSVSFADQACIELTLPKAQAGNMGVIAKRPIANAVWRYDAEPSQGYHVDYWKRLQKLNYDFTRGDARTNTGPDGAAGTALRFTLAVPGVDVAIVGTTKPERWKQNADLLRQGGPLPHDRYEAIRARWKEVAAPDWTGRT